MADTESRLADVQKTPHNGSQTAVHTTRDGSHELSEEEKSSRETRPANVVQPSSTTPNSEFPSDGGRQAWLVVAGAWVCFFVSYGFISSAGVYQDYYQRTLLRDSSQRDCVDPIPSAVRPVGLRAVCG